MQSPVSSLRRAASDVDGISEVLTNNGVCVITGVYSKKLIAELHAAYKETVNTVSGKFESQGQWLKRKYDVMNTKTAMLDKILDENKLFFYENGQEIAKYMGPGRYDIYPDSMQEGIFASKDFRYPEGVRQIIKKELQNDYYEYAGALPSSGGNGDGTWHRDIYSLFENDEFDIAMPNFYFTMLIPLVNITDEDGPTEVIVGSHKTAYHKTGVPKNPEKIRCTDLNPGDVVLMNGKAVHRGSANNGLRERDYLYIVFQKKWYDDNHKMWEDEHAPPPSKL